MLHFKNTSVIFSFLLTYSIIISKAQGYIELNKVELKKEWLNSNFKNPSKIHLTRIDEARGYVYIYSQMTNFISILDLNYKPYKEIGDIELPFESVALEYMFIDTLTGYLYLKPESDDNIYIINPLTEQHLFTFTNDGFKQGGIAFNAKSEEVYIANDDTVFILNSKTFSFKDTIVYSLNVSGMAYDYLHGQLILTPNMKVGGKYIYDFISLQNHKIIKTLQLTIEDELPFIYPNEFNDNRIILISRNYLAVIDTLGNIKKYSGNPLYIKVQQAVSDVCYAYYNQTAYMLYDDGYIEEGEHGRYGKLYSINTINGNIDSMKVGLLASKIDVDNKKGLAVWTNKDEGLISIYDLQNENIDTFDISETIDHLCLSSNGNNLYIAKRLGGNRVMKLNTKTFSLSEDTAGIWPCMSVYDTTNNQVYVLNHYESTISILDSNGTNYKTIDITGWPEGRTDGVGFISLDQVNHNLYVIMAEQEEIKVINVVKKMVVDSSSIPGFVFDDSKHNGLGSLQLIALPEYNKLYVLQTKEARLCEFSLSPFTFVDDLVFTSTQWGEQKFDADMFYNDSYLYKLFLGNIIIDPTVKLSSSSIDFLPSGERAIGRNSSNTIFYSMSTADSSVYIHELDPNTLNLINTKKLFSSNYTLTPPPIFAYNPNLNHLFIAEFQYAILHEYNLDTTTLITNTQNIPTINTQNWLNVYPNPFTNQINYNLKINSEMPTIEIYNSFGQKIYDQNKSNWTPNKNFTINTNPYPSGIYYMKATINNESALIRLIKTE